MHGGFASFDRIIDVPFVARHARHGRDATRAAFGLPLDRPLALSSFGGYGVDDLDLNRLDCLDTWAVAVTGQAGAVLPAGVHLVEDNQIYARGFRYEDLVHAVDVVVTKPGYGIVSECVANGTAMVYTSRGRFAEYPVLVSAMREILRSAYLSHEDLFAGRWRAALDAARSAPAPPRTPPTNGAEVIASMIESLLF
jgi:L-arabinokinase